MNPLFVKALDTEEKRLEYSANPGPAAPWSGRGVLVGGYFLLRAAGLDYED